MDGWFGGNEASSSSGSHGQRLFDAYRSSFCSLENQSVPGLAYREGLPYIELSDSDLANSASMQVQQQFYQEAGIKTAVFMGCKSGEIELGMSTLNIRRDFQTRIQSMFTEDTIRQFSEHDIVQIDQSRPSSSSSSLRSLSVGSPEYSSLVLSKPMKETSSHHTTSMQPYSPYFPTPSADDAAMAHAMLVVLSSESVPAAAPPLLYHPPEQPIGAFKPYEPILPQRFEFKPNAHTQKMIKLAMSISRRANMTRLGTVQEERPVTTSQLHHMISERKRREKLNESFDALRMLLPPGSKKDKASVLAKTRDYVSTLKSQISELEKKNKMLEGQQSPLIIEANNAGDESEVVQVMIIKSSESTSEIHQMSIRVTVRVECDMISFVLHILECLKEMSAITMKSVDASAYSLQQQIISQATLSIQVKAIDWDEESFKEAVTKAVLDGITQPAAATVTPS